MAKLSPLTPHVPSLPSLTGNPYGSLLQSEGMTNDTGLEKALLAGGSGTTSSGNSLLAALSGAQERPIDDPFGIAASVIGKTSPLLVNPYGSPGKNAMSVVGAGILAALLAHQAHSDTNADNAAHFPVMQKFLAGNSDDRAALMADPNNSFLSKLIPAALDLQISSQAEAGKNAQALALKKIEGDAALQKYQAEHANDPDKEAGQLPTNVTQEMGALAKLQSSLPKALGSLDKIQETLKDNPDITNWTELKLSGLVPTSDLRAWEANSGIMVNSLAAAGGTGRIPVSEIPAFAKSLTDVGLLARGEVKDNLLDTTQDLKTGFETRFGAYETPGSKTSKTTQYIRDSQPELFAPIDPDTGLPKVDNSSDSAGSSLTSALTPELDSAAASLGGSVPSAAAASPSQDDIMAEIQRRGLGAPDGGN